jgi:purine-binding chemotaxis protein CheW
MAPSAARAADSALLFRVGGRLCALALEHVVETMRPRPVERLTGGPRCVTGLVLVRGEMVPVLDARILLGREAEDEDGGTADGARPPGRLVTLRVAERTVALAVDEVVDVRALPPGAAGDVPPLLRDADAGIVAAIGALDRDLLVVLRAARVVAAAPPPDARPGGAP